MVELVPLRIPAAGASAPPVELKRFFYDVYCDTPNPLRWLGSIRPYVCPYDKLVAFVPPRASVLDLGCGPGSLLNLMAATTRIARGVGCDVSAAPLKSARAAARRLGAEKILAFEHVRSMKDVPAGPFDAVVMVDVLHHVPAGERRDVIATAVDRVGPGGVFVYKDMTTRSRLRRLAHNLDDYAFTGEWVMQVPDGLVEKWAGELGLVLEHSEYIPRLVYGHEFRVFRRPC